MPTYANGYIPADLLVTFERGYNSTDGHWNHSLSAATYSRHLALVNRAYARTGRTLTISSGWGAYRPYAAQVIARNVYGNGAAWPGTSSHGGFWEGRQTLAMDYSNWSWVYGGDRAAFAADCAAVGLTANMIVPSRGYPDEPWHVIDLDPWSAVPAGGGETEFDMPLDGADIGKIWNTKIIKHPLDAKLDITPAQFFSDLAKIVWGFGLNRPDAPGVVTSAGDLLRYEPAEHDNTRKEIGNIAIDPAPVVAAVREALAGTPGIDPALIEKAAQAGAAAALSGLTLKSV
jgi:hypothetical protein